MVFCGKPSKGCKNCRIRRIKCDRIDPACSQCLRAGKACPGYRDQLALLFRDESDEVVRKAKVPRNTPQHRKPPPSHRTSIRSSNSPHPTTPTTPTSVIPLSESHALVPSPGSFFCASSPRRLDEGVIFFFHHYVTINSNFLSGRVDLPEIPVLRLVYDNEAFNDAVSSVGYAGLSNVTKHPEYMIIARKKYAASLRSITLALKDTSSADLDTIFKSTMILAAFEIVNGAGSWAVHLNGGAAILKLLVSMQGPRIPPMRMQLQFVFIVYIKCIVEGEACPPNNVWSPHLKSTMSPHDALATDLAYIMAWFTNFHASIRSKLVTDSNTKLREALLLDAMLEEWELQLPQSWLYKLEQHTEETAVMFKGVSHRYCDFWTTRMYNHYRWCRILVNELLVTQLGPHSADAAQRSKSLDIISRQAADICSSVSIQFHQPTLLEETKQTGVPALSGCFLPLFQLAVAGSAMGVDDETHNWVVSVLELIGHEKGVGQALTLIPGIKLQREKWKLFTHGPADCSLLSGFVM